MSPLRSSMSNPMFESDAVHERQDRSKTPLSHFTKKTTHRSGASTRDYTSFDDNASILVTNPSHGGMTSHGWWRCSQQMDGDHQLGKTTSAFCPQLQSGAASCAVASRCQNSRTPFVRASQYGKLKPGRHFSLSRTAAGCHDATRRWVEAAISHARKTPPPCAFHAAFSHDSRWRYESNRRDRGGGG